MGFLKMRYCYSVSSSQKDPRILYIDYKYNLKRNCLLLTSAQ